MLCGLIFAGLICTIPTAMVFMGIQHLHQCPMEKWIPIWMIVAGSGLFMVILCHTFIIIGNKTKYFCIGICSVVLLILTEIFMSAWNIGGSVWVFKKWSSWSTVKATDEGCHHGLYMFAFVYLIIYWVSVPCRFKGTVNHVYKQRERTDREG